MRKSLILIVGLVAALAVCVTFLLGRRMYIHFEKDNTSGFRTFRYGYSDSFGTVSYWYEINAEKEIPTLQYGELGLMSRQDHEDKTIAPIVELDSDFMEKMNGLYTKYHVAKWNGYHQRDKNVMDGPSFSVYAIYNDGNYLSISGTTIAPDGFENYLGELNALVRPYIEEARSAYEKKVYCPITHLRYEYSTPFSDSYYYDLDLFEGTAELSYGDFELMGVNYDEPSSALMKIIGRSKMTEIYSAYQKYHSEDWDNYDERNEEVLDGWSVRLIVTFEDGTSATTTGLNVAPDDFFTFTDTLDEILKSDIDSMRERYKTRNS